MPPRPLPLSRSIIKRQGGNAPFLGVVNRYAEVDDLSPTGYSLVRRPGARTVLRSDTPVSSLFAADGLFGDSLFFRSGTCLFSWDGSRDPLPVIRDVAELGRDWWAYAAGLSNTDAGGTSSFGFSWLWFSNGATLYVWTDDVALRQLQIDNASLTLNAGAVAESSISFTADQLRMAVVSETTFRIGEQYFRFQPAMDVFVTYFGPVISGAPGSQSAHVNTRRIEVTGGVRTGTQGNPHIVRTAYFWTSGTGPEMSTTSTTRFTAGSPLNVNVTPAAQQVIFAPGFDDEDVRVSWLQLASVLSRLVELINTQTPYRATLEAGVLRVFAPEPGAADNLTPVEIESLRLADSFAGSLQDPSGAGFAYNYDFSVTDPNDPVNSLDTRVPNALRMALLSRATDQRTVASSLEILSPLSAPLSGGVDADDPPSSVDPGSPETWASGFARVPLPDGSPPGALAENNKYVVVAVSGSDRMYWIEPGETNIDPTHFFSSEYSGDPVEHLESLGDLLHVFSRSSVETFQNSGDAESPFQRISGVTFPLGVRTGSVRRIRDRFFFAGGDGNVYVLSGLSVSGIISTPTVADVIRTGSLEA